MALKNSKSKVNITKKSTVGIIATSNASVNVAGDVNVNVYDTSQNDLEFGDFDLPRLTNTFKGREEEMQILDNLYFTQKETNVVICGLPGFGKTELSKQYANRCVENNKIHRVFWVNSENKDDLRNSFKTLKKIYTSFKEKLTMFVFDNAACMQDIFDYMPPDNENNLLLITSREKDWKDIRPVPIDPLSSASAVEVYKSFLKEQFREEHHDMYVKLAAVVDYVPLGLQITGAFVREQIMALQEKFDFRQYITLLQESKKDILNATIPLNVPNTYKKSIYGAIIVSLKKIQSAQEMKSGDFAINILYMCSFLNPDRIEFKDLLDVSAITDLLETNNNENEIEFALHLLANLLFINYKINDKYLTIHRLIQDVVRLHLLKCDDEVRFRAYTMSLQLTFETRGDFGYFSHCNTVLIYADENVPSILNFYKKHAFKRNEILSRFLSSLIACECFACLTNIVADSNIMNRKYMTESNLKSEALLKLLKRYDIDLKKPDAWQITPLHFAASKINLYALKIITACNVDLNARDSDGGTALSHFIRKVCQREKINIDEANQILDLLKLDENKNVTNNNGQTVLHYASYYSFHNTEMLHLLLKRGLDVNSKCKDQSTALHIAARGSNLDAMKLLIQNNADLNARDCDGDTALLHFIRTWKREYINENEVNKILDLLKLDENKNVTNNLGHSLLYYASYYSSHNTGLLNLLLKRGLDINRKCNDQGTALHAAALGRNLDVIKLLIKNNAELNARDSTGETPLFCFIRCACVCERINIDEVKQILDLLKLYENKEVRNNVGHTLLHYASFYCSHNTEILCLLLKSGLDINSKCDDQSTALHMAARGCNLDAMKLLIQNNADLNARDGDGDTALLHFIRNAYKRENINIDEVNQILDLFKLNENKNVRNNVGHTLLYYSAYYSFNNTGLLNLLLNRGLDINSKSNDQRTALHAAALGSNLDVIELLIKNNVDLNARDSNGETALFCFIRSVCECESINIDEVIHILDLLNLDENKNVRNNLGHTLLHCASFYSSQNTEILHLLLKRGLNINSKCNDHTTALHRAALRGNLDAMKLLIRNKIDLNATDCDGETALFYFIRGTYMRYNINNDELNEILNMLQCKANKNDTDNYNNTLLFFAAESCHANIITLLITQCDMNVNHQNLQGDTPLHNVIKLEDLFSRREEDIIRSVEILKKYGSRLDIKNKTGKTPLLIAREISAEFLIPYLTETDTVSSGTVADHEKYKWLSDIKSKLKMKFMYK